MNEIKPFTGACSDVAIAYDLSCKQPETFIINDALTQVYKLLKSIGFKLYEATDILPVGFDEDFNWQIADPSRVIMIESEISRNMMCVVLSEYNGEYDYEVHVQDDIGCGWVKIPLRWSEISLDWLTHLKMAIEGHGFNK